MTLRQLHWLVAGLALPLLAGSARSNEPVTFQRSQNLIATNMQEAPKRLPGTNIVEPEPIHHFAGGIAPYSDAPVLPGHAWPAYTPYNNFASMAYQTQYPAGAWPFIGPPYPYPMVPSGWRHVSLKWRGGYWWMRFHAR